MKIKLLIALITIVTLWGCNTMMLTPVNFAWPIESALTTDDTGTISENRYAITINVNSLFTEEFGLNADVKEKIVHIIRNEKGYYFLTSDSFKNVYIFVASEGSLKLVKKVLIDEKGLNNPAFNQREPNIELIYKNGDAVLLNGEGIVGGKK
ncbi:MAG TPA: hypothetical protein PL041_13310 [Melioribacteraceae bacterium]|nr:hypothetical protein [Melioribacteraceae bacterium]